MPSEDLKQQIAVFITENNIVGTCAGVLIGLVTKEVVLSLVADIIVPCFILLFMQTHTTFMTNILGAKYKSALNVTNFLSNLITWVLAIVITYFFIQFAFIKLIGASGKKPDKPDKPDKADKADKADNTNNAVAADADGGTDAFTNFRY